MFSNVYVLFPHLIPCGVEALGKAGVLCGLVLHGVTHVDPQPQVECRVLEDKGCVINHTRIHIF